jgi:hypothetical protein
VFQWLHSRPIRRTRPEVIELVERALITGGDSAWDDFISIKIMDPELEVVRQKCSNANLEPKKVFEETLREILAQLRTTN